MVNLRSSQIVDDNPKNPLLPSIDSLISGWDSINQITRERLRLGVLRKAEIGMLRIPLPTGYEYTRSGKIIKDSREEVRFAIQLAFDLYESLSSLKAVVHYFREKNLKFPVRCVDREDGDKIVWKSLTKGMLYRILKNPTYAGAYVYGRAVKSGKAAEDTIGYSSPKHGYRILIKDHFEGYMTWGCFESNQCTLANNQVNRMRKVVVS